jgi:hypothetical protein
MKNQDHVVDHLPQDDPVDADEGVPVKARFGSFDSFFKFPEEDLQLQSKSYQKSKHFFQVIHFSCEFKPTRVWFRCNLILNFSYNMF